MLAAFQAAEVGRPPLLERVVTLTQPHVAERLVREHLERPDAPIRTVRPVGVRPKGSAGGLVTYALEMADGAKTFATARVARKSRLRIGWERMESERVKWTGDLAPGALVEDDGVLLLSFPLDRRLRWLRPYTEAEKAKGLLYEARVVAAKDRVSKQRSHVSLASYRAERRAVLRWDFDRKTRPRDKARRTVYVRLHSDRAPVLRSAMALRAAHAAGVPTPQSLLVEMERNIAVESAVGGSFSRSGARETADAHLLGGLVARLHRVPSPDRLPVPGPHHRLARAARAINGLGTVAAGLGTEARDRLDRLTAHGTRPVASLPALLHGDLHSDQLVVGSAERISWTLIGRVEVCLLRT